MECGEQTRSEELCTSTRFHRLVYSEIEEIGWEHLGRLGGDLTFLSLRILDKKGRVHFLEIQLDTTYPKCPPSISADVPYIFDLEWSTHSRLKNVVQQFQEHLEKLQEFWSTLEDIDKALWVDHKMSSLAMSSRSINIGNDCFIILSINVMDPRSLPEIRFVGSGQHVDMMRMNWQRNRKQWKKDSSFVENLTCLLETQLPSSPVSQKNDQQVECGICYAQCLPFDDELGDKSGSGTDYMCENISCHKAFHSICLGDWLRSITTTRQSFNVLFGNCPYCSEPVAVKINVAKQ
ncbi:uncharacterized protein LOC115712235 isoform X1 [Cannabis sativa]|uniref:uncharacterized protein LOC115712235 isoform X1 n=1 Tax=Cannabis sativa TaxID=3483 RepID=UPI0029C9E661|nr:uncharacterized protein LOC115712235 isoform X1 [Cannabis sativa]